MTRRSYQELREAREARRREIEKAAGWSDQPGKAWSRSARRRQALRTKSRKPGATPR